MTLTKDDLTGLFTAIVTPFTADKAVDYDALKALVKFQLDSGATGIVPIGGTGEYPALSRAERAGVVSACVEAADGAPVLPGILATGYEDAVEAGRDFAAAGAAGAMLVAPYYVEGPQAGIRAYFEAFRSAVDLPLLAYMIPRRTGVAMKPDTLARLAHDETIVGIKFSSYDIPDFIATVRDAGNAMAVLGGEEPLFATHVALGAVGGVLASASIYPRQWIEVYEAARSGDLATALGLQHRLDPVVQSVFLETNPGPLKRYMELAGFRTGGVRLPLTEPSADTVAALKEAYRKMGPAAAA